ncbi:hypothetical protein SAMN05428941_4767 [Streptomyces sp. 2114.2]|nr:hypothetical protein BX268_4771 [Streptomyces sp. 2221.1]SDT71552.1 hypothetical protein SAMN05428941_4767 [Streptomyces sp. 2114.2]
MSGGVRPQRLARQRPEPFQVTDSAPFRGRTPPDATPTHPPDTYATSQSSTPANSFPFTSSGAADPRTD